MKTKIEKFNLPFGVPELTPTDAVVDIEASGRFWRTSQILRIDLAVPADSGNNAITLTQWVLEKESDEYDMLVALSEALTDRTRILTFNGHSFDLPHLRNKYKAYGMTDPLMDKSYLDLYLALKDTAALFALPSRRLADFSVFLGMDPGRPEAVRTAELLSLLRYEAFLKSEPEIVSVSSDGERLIYELSANEGFPRDVSMHDACFHVRFKAEGRVVIAAHIESGALRFYHTDLENYVFLPLEGYAIHKSMATYVDKSRREKVTRETCYHLVKFTEEFLTDPVRYRNYLNSILFFLHTR